MERIQCIDEERAEGMADFAESRMGSLPYGSSRLRRTGRHGRWSELGFGDLRQIIRHE
jgi:hypothetical protein